MNWYSNCAFSIQDSIRIICGNNRLHNLNDWNQTLFQKFSFASLCLHSKCVAILPLMHKIIIRGEIVNPNGRWIPIFIYEQVIKSVLLIRITPTLIFELWFYIYTRYLKLFFLFILSQNLYSILLNLESSSFVSIIFFFSPIFKEND